MTLSLFDQSLFEKVTAEKFPEKDNFNKAEILIILNEMTKAEKYYPKGKITKGEKYKVFKYFVRYCLYRNLANFDTMLLLTGDKGLGKSSFAIMLSREWCHLLGISFSSKNHMAYSNQQVTERINNLPRFSPLVCLSGTTKIIIKTPESSTPYYENMNKLVGRNDFEVKTYNVEKDAFEFIKPEGCIQTARRAKVYKIELMNGKKITATENHQFLTQRGYVQLKDLTEEDEIIINSTKCLVCNKEFVPKNPNTKCCCKKCINKYREQIDPEQSIKYKFSKRCKMLKVKIKSITRVKKSIPVYDIVGVPKNHNFVANNMIVHNCDEAVNFCSAAEWAKLENRELKKKIAQVRTRHLFFILCWPMKVNKIEKTYLDSFVNYWIHIMKRGVGAIFVKDINPVTDSWRLSLFKDIGGFTEFTGIDKIKKKLSSHPNFWYIITAPKPSEEFYKRYLVVREKNIYNAEGVLSNMSRQDIHKALLIKVLQDIMVRDSSLSMKRLILHIKNEYGFDMKESELKKVLEDSEMLIEKLKTEKYNLGSFKDEGEWKNISDKEGGEDDYEEGTPGAP